MNTCRVCHEPINQRSLSGRISFSYATRHWAHYGCYLKKHGSKGLERLANSTIERFPALTLQDHGLWEFSQSLIKKRRGEK